MPRAEVPESVTRYTISLNEFSPPGEVAVIAISDLPAIKAHWLEQLKEELLSKEQIYALTKEIVEGSDGEVISLPYRTVEDALRERLQSVASIPIEEGGDE